MAENHQAEQKQPSRERWTARVAPVVVLALLCVGLLWKLVLTNEFTWLESGDLANQVLPWWQFQAGEWQKGRIPLWDPHQWAGQPLLAQGQPGSAYPLNWILFSLPLKNGWLRHGYLLWYFVLARFFAAWFTYLLCRDNRCSRTASVLGGILFAFSGLMPSFDWPQMFNGAVWAPLVLLCVLRIGRGERALRSSALGGVALGISWLSGHHQIPIFLSLTSGLILLYFIFRRRVFDRPGALAAALFFTMCVITSALQTLPSWEYGRHAVRWVNLNEPIRWQDKVPYLVHQNYSTAPQTILGIAIPNLDLVRSPYVGPTATGLAVLALVFAFGNATVRILAGVAAGAFVFSLGSATPLHGWLYSLVPLVDKSRTPAFSVIILSLSLAVLCAFGIDTCRTCNLRWFRRALFAFGGTVLLIFAVLHIAGRPMNDNALAVVAMTSLLAGAVVTLSERSRITFPQAQFALAALAMLDVSLLVGVNWQSRFQPDRREYLKYLRQANDVVAFLQTMPQPVRVQVDSRALPHNVGDWLGFDQATGFLASVTEEREAVGNSGRSHQLLGVGYYLAAAPSEASQALIYKGSGGLNLYQLRGTLPRLRTVHRTESVPHVPYVMPKIDDPASDLSSVAYLVGEQPSLEVCSGDRVRFEHYSPNRVRIQADMACRGMVILADTWDPGWKAKVDGHPERIYPAYGGLRGVIVDRGSHTIDMAYRPATVYIGAAMTAFGLLAGMILLVSGGRRRP